MKVSAYQYEAVDSNEFGLQGNLPKAQPSADAAGQSKTELPSKQKSLREQLRINEDFSQYGLKSDMRKPESSGPITLQGKVGEPAAMQRSTVARLQSSTPSVANALASKGGEANASYIITLSSFKEKPAVAPTGSTGGSPQALLDKYDGGSGKPSQSYTKDQYTTEQLVQYLSRSLTGMPPVTVKDQTAVAGMSAQLAQMDEQTREGYAVRAMTLLKQPPVQRAAGLAALTSEMSQEVRDIQRDPVRRLAAIFNAPVGAQFLGKQGQAQIDTLRKQYDAFVTPGAGDAGRAKALESAVLVKTQMKEEIGRAIATKDASEQKAWGESAKRIDRILDEAEKYATHTVIPPTPGTTDTEWNERRAEAYAKTSGYQSIGEKLLSDDMLSKQERDHPGWWPESTTTARTPDEKARDLLTFQQGLNDPNSAISKRVQALESIAVHQLAENGDKDHNLDQVAAPKLYTDIAGALPEADGKFVQNLAQKYLDTTQDIDEKSRQMLREHTPDTVDKVLYAVGKVLNSLAPVPGLDWLAGQLLDAAIPNHGGLNSNEEAVIDTTLMVGGLLMGGLEKLPLLKDKLGMSEVLEKSMQQIHSPETVLKPSLPNTARETIAAVWKTPKGEAEAQPSQQGDEKKPVDKGASNSASPHVEDRHKQYSNREFTQKIGKNRNDQKKGTHSNRTAEKKRLGIDPKDKSFSSEHAILNDVNVAHGGRGKKVSYDDPDYKNANHQLEAYGMAYQEVDDYHKAHVGSRNGSASDEYAELQFGALKNRDPALAIQLNQLYYSQSEKFRWGMQSLDNLRIKQNHIARESYIEAVMAKNQYFWRDGGTETINSAKVSSVEKIELIIARLVAELRRIPTNGELAYVIDTHNNFVGGDQYKPPTQIVIPPGYLGKLHMKAYENDPIF